MAKASDNVFPKVILGMQPTAPAAPADSSWKVYSAADGIYARSSNTTVALGGAAVSAGSNATRVSETAGAGVGPTYSYSDHRHDGIGQITSSSSNTLQRGTINLRAGANVGISASDTDGDGEFDTVTISATGGGGVGSSLAVAVSRQVSGADYTRNSSSYADIDATNLSLTMTTGAHPVKVTLAGEIGINNTANAANIDVLVDGTGLGGNGAWQFRPVRASEYQHWTFTYVTAALSAGSHTIKLQWKVDGNTVTMRRSSTPLVFMIEELAV